MTDLPNGVPPSRRGLLGFGLVAALGIPVLDGCTALDKATSSPDLYTLNPPTDFPPGPEVRWQLVVTEPAAPRQLDTDYIALEPAPTEVKYFENARWAERAPRMIQTMLVEAFENSKRVMAVGRQAIGLRSDFVIALELRAFQAEYYGLSGTAPRIHVRLNAKIVLQPQQIITTAENFDAVVVAKANSVRAVVDAFNEATSQAIGALVQWALAQRNPNEGKLLAN